MVSKRGWKVAQLGLMTIAMVLVLSIACHASTVTGLAVRKADDKVEIHLASTGPLQYRVLSQGKPRQALVIEMHSASVLKQAEKTVQIDKGIIERARVERTSAGTVRLVVEVLHPVKYTVQRNASGLVLVMDTQTIAAQESKAVPKMAAGESTMESPVAVTPPVVETKKTETKVAYRHVDTRAAQIKAAPRRTKPVKQVSLDFVNADLIYVLKLLAKELDVNLVTDASVTGSVTMSLKNVSAQTALNIIITLNGFKQKKLGNILFVGSEDTMNIVTADLIDYQPTGEMKVQVYNLEYIRPSEAISAIKGQYPLVSVKEGGPTSIIAQANLETLQNIRSIVSGIDVPAPEVAPPPTEKMEIVRLRYATASEMVTMLETLLGGNKPEVMEVDERVNAIIFKGEEDAINYAKNYIDEIDAPLPQVMLSVKVVDLSEAGAKNLGVSWQVGAEDGTQPIKFYEIPSDYPRDVGGYNPYDETQPAKAAPMPLGFFVRDPFVLQASLSVQVTSGEAKVLASPRVATISGKEATIHVGEQFPVVYYDPRAGQYQVIYVPIGIRLTVKPTITPDGYIEAEIKPTVSNLLELINNQYPRTAERSADVNVRVKDGNTIVIGGMIDENTRTNTTKVPLLGDIPILGYMFRSTSTDRSKKEVVIMITPKIMAH